MLDALRLSVHKNAHVVSENIPGVLVNEVFALLTEVGESVGQFIYFVHDFLELAILCVLLALAEFPLDHFHEDFRNCFEGEPGGEHVLVLGQRTLLVQECHNVPQFIQHSRNSLVFEGVDSVAQRFNIAA
jgi:hypothetical protein